MATFRKGNYVADLGAMVVTGLGKIQMVLYLHTELGLNIELKHLWDVCSDGMVINVFSS